MAITRLNEKNIIDRGYEIRAFTYDDDIGSRSEERRRKGLWMIERMKGELKVFLTCPSCAVITTLSRGAAIDSHGYIYDSTGSSMGCVICSNCRAHFFVRFKNWTKKSKEMRSKDRRKSCRR